MRGGLGAALMHLPRNAQTWLVGYLRWRLAQRRRPQQQGLTHVLWCMCDHFEPGHGDPGLAIERTRMNRWRSDFPGLARSFTDADGWPIQHTFFFPAEQYRPEHLDALGEICGSGYGEVEVHLHHDHDTSSHLRRHLLEFRDVLAERHELLGRDARGNATYAFIHGNWALDNSRPDGRWCGVNDELTVLRETGCYADFTLPSAPSAAQTRTINSIYYAADDPQRPKSHDTGAAVCVGALNSGGMLLMVQGPLTLDWRRRKFWLLPTLETGAIDGSLGHRPDIRRARQWVDVGIGVIGRPDWVFVKLYTHGAPEANADVLLGEQMYRFHEDVQREFNDGDRFALHYVTAREMANLVWAAERSAAGSPGAHRDACIGPPPAIVDGPFGTSIGSA